MYLFLTQSDNWPGHEQFPVKFHFKEEQKKDIRKELDLPEEVSSFLCDVMQLYPPRRPSARDILKHPFFEDVSGEPFQIQKLYDENVDKLLEPDK